MKDRNNYNKVYSVIRQSEGYLTHIRGTKLNIQVQVNPQFGPNGDKNSDLMIKWSKLIVKLLKFWIM